MRSTLKVKITMLLVTAFSMISTNGSAEAPAKYPTQPIRLMVGFSPGSATDVVARVIAHSLSQRLGQTVVVDNKTGVGGSLAADTVAKAKPDGYTLLFVSSAIAVNPAVYSKLSFDVVNDLTPISLIGRVPVVLLINQAVPAKTLREFVSLAKTQPGVFNFGSSGQGGSIHMATELFAMTAGVKLTHVPYRGNSQASTALQAGDVQVLVDTVINAAPQLKSSRMRALAVTGDARSPLVPELQTFKEVGMPSFDANVFFGVMGPANMAPAVLDRLNKEIVAVLESKDVEKRLIETGGLTLASGKREEFQATLRKELAMWKTVAAEAKVTAE